MKKSYKITVDSEWAVKLTHELKAWGIPPKSYTVTIETSNPNALDVATETFINNPELFKIETIKATKE